MRMLYWMNGHTRQDRIRNECIREKVGLTLIIEKIMVWACVLQRGSVDVPMRRVDQMEGNPVARGRGRLRKTKPDV